MKAYARPLALACTGLAIFLLAIGCASKPATQEQCISSQEQRGSGHPVTVGSFCSSKEQYEVGETVHLTVTVKNALTQTIVLGDGQGPVLDISVPYDGRRSDYAPSVPTRIELGPGQTYSLTWDWPPPNVDPSKVKPLDNQIGMDGSWIGLDGGKGPLLLLIYYGPRIDPGL